MKYVLDTNVVSALMGANQVVVERLSGADKEDVLVPQPVLAEIAYGLERLPKSKRKETLRQQFKLVSKEITRCPWTDEVSEAFGSLKASLERRGERIEDFDVAIAAHALALGAVLVTANLGHMKRVPGLIVEDWAQPDS